MKVTLTIELELESDPGNDEVLDAWAWSMENPLEELALVHKASVIDFTADQAVTT